MQGKTQLFPSEENDFYRNRLTHSLEVAQIASGIALDLNEKHKKTYLKGAKIDVDLVTFAALAHDLGHPPFGHRGERILDKLMIEDGGFEGNAQTLRILAKLEKKTTLSFPGKEGEPSPVTSNSDNRTGLNLSFRTLASILKYDAEIPLKRDIDKWKKPAKGYYKTEADLVKKIKKSVAPSVKPGDFRTIECSIMDIADDIAYSTYDLEDAFKAEFITPASMASRDDKFKSAIVKFINQKMAEEYDSATVKKYPMTVEELDEIIAVLFDDLFSPSDALSDLLEDKNRTNTEKVFASSASVNSTSDALVEDGYYRSDFTSRLVYTLMSGIELFPNMSNPQLSVIRFGLPTFKMVETLKRFAYHSLIESPRLRLAEYRGHEIISQIFKVLTSDDGDQLMPSDWRNVYHAQSSKTWRMRTVCDFIACMTDRYCGEFYSRLMGIHAPSFHKPH